MKMHGKFINTLLFIVSYLTFLMPGNSALPEIPEDAQEAKIWESNRINTIQEIQRDPEKSIPDLTRMLRQLKVLGYRECPEKHRVVDLLERKILGIPGHAKYFTNLLEQKKQGMLADKVSYHEYTLAQEALSVLAYLPSPETVAELGKLISDPVGRDGKLLGGGDVWEGDGWFPVNCQIALRCFDALPIENGPKLTNDDFGAENFSGVDKWKDWWEEVKAGKRTYRFKGSPIEYGPDGPVSAKELEGRQRDRQRGSVSAGTSASKKQEEDMPANLDGRWRWTAWLGTAVASIFLLIAAWRVFRKPSRGL